MPKFAANLSFLFTEHAFRERFRLAAAAGFQGVEYLFPYDWPAHEKTGFNWWIKRMAHNIALYDVVRLDHFRGFEAYWEIPASEATAVRGEWIKAPGMALFKTMLRHFPSLVTPRMTM